uniref:Uncharacterized protein n=1 Tax=Anguilla anguilla TaxID=7936 RepID=A0A0E9Q2Z4_ANGAN
MNNLKGLPSRNMTHG